MIFFDINRGTLVLISRLGLTQPTEWFSVILVEKEDKFLRNGCIPQGKQISPLMECYVWNYIPSVVSFTDPSPPP